MRWSLPCVLLAGRAAALGLALCPVVLLGTAYAEAARAGDEDSAEARAARHHFDLGEAFYRSGKLEAARLEFETAYRLYPVPLLLWNLGKVAEKQGRKAEAIDYLERYVRAQRDEAQRKAEADALAEVQTSLERLRSEVAPAAAPQADVKPPEQSSTPSLPAPSLSPAPSPQEPEGAARSSGRPPALALGLLAGGGAVVLAGIGCGAAALALGRDVHDRAAQPYDQLAADFERGRALDGATIGLSVIGGVALGAGAAVWIYDAVKRRQSRSRPSAPLALYAPLRF